MSEGEAANQKLADLSERCHGSSDVLQVCDWPLQAFGQTVHEWEDVVHVCGRAAVESGAEGSFPETTLLSERQLQLVGVEEDRTHRTEDRELRNLHLQLLQGQQGIMGKESNFFVWTQVLMVELIC